MTIPTIKELVKKQIVTHIEAINKFAAKCQKCGGTWLLRFNRVSKECNLCKAQRWWLESEKRGPKVKSKEENQQA